MAKYSKIYKYYRNQNLSLQERFVDSEKSVDDVVNALNKNNRIFNGFKGLLKEACMYYLGNVKIEKYYIEWAIMDFASKKGYSATGNDWESYFSNSYKRNVTLKVEDDKIMFIQSRYGDLVIKKLSAEYPKLLEKIPQLETEKRQGMCHSLAIGVATSFEKPCDVVTGTVWSLHKKEESLHSWTEIEIEGKTYVLDTMFNAVFEKEQYYKFFNVVEMERISNKTLIEEASRVAPFLKRGWNYYKLYLSSHDEMMKLIEREEQKENQRREERNIAPWIVDNEDLLE